LEREPFGQQSIMLRPGNPKIGRLESFNPFERDGVRGCEPSSKGAGPICCNLFKRKEHNDR
jgi:hypothetical protein